MGNPFDDDAAIFSVLVNDEGQFSLWPAFADVPAGWSIAYDEDSQELCLEYIERTWRDMRPRGLASEMEREGYSPGAATG
jgi:MbtH protein